ncbi:MAG: prephenate dehydratase [Thermonemataceae bacterium]
MNQEELHQTLQTLRERIDEIDRQMLQLLEQRMAEVQHIGDLKKANNAIIYRPEREKQILDRLERLSQGVLKRSAIDAIFLEIFAISRNVELPEKVAYLGPTGSFSHQAAESRFGAMSEYIPLSTIKAVFESVDTERVRFGVVPIENNQEGTVVETVNLLNECEVHIVAEIPMPIHFALASKEEALQSIQKIYSKGIAFRQCRQFLGEYFPHAEQVNVNSTSMAAQLAAQQPATAALCSSIAAKIYDLPGLFENIEDNAHNATRFLIISKEFVNNKSEQDKTTILTNLPDQAGSLAVFLQEFDRFGINLNKIESHPIKNEAKFKYWFYIDFAGHFTDENVQRIFNKYEGQIRCLGSYVKLC